MNRLFTVALVALLGLPAVVLAQEASIAGTVTDSTGSVLPGVTVEATSPSLIEKSRAVVTDGGGRYRIINLPPGTYLVRFVLAGFAAVERPGIQLSGSFAATVNGELSVGSLEDTITVTGATPIIDTQNVAQQRVMNREVLDLIPVGRTAHDVGILLPGVTMAQGATDAGGTVSPAITYSLASHGSRRQDQAITQSGMRITGLSREGYSIQGPVNNVATQEFVYDTAGASIESLVGGVVINYIPREGGNTYRGTAYFSTAPASLQSSNLTQRLRDAGLRSPDSIKRNFDVNVGAGGPLMQDKLWFFLTGRYAVQSNYVSDQFFARNFNDPTARVFEPDLTRRAYNETSFPDAQLRMSWQATPRHKFGLTFHEQIACHCPTGVSPTRAMESALEQEYQVRTVQGDWVAPLTNRLLFEAGASYVGALFLRRTFDELDTSIVLRREQSSGLFWGGPYFDLRTLRNEPIHKRAVVSYVTGTHAAKVGLTHSHGYGWERKENPRNIQYQLNAGVPNQITLYAEPWEYQTNIDHDMAVFAQDRWAIRNRLTLTYGIRYDYFANSFPEQRVAPAQFAPARNFVFPKEKNAAWHDLSPRVGAAYDLFGNGKTVLKIGLNRYLSSFGAETGLSADTNPIRSLVSQTTRSWDDVDGDLVPDCDLTNPASNAECGPLADTNFGKTVRGNTLDPELQRGFGARPFNWEFSTSLQRELHPRVAFEATFVRRSYGNLVAVDNRTLGPADFDTFSITAPQHPDLPDGGGYVVSGVDVKPQKFGLPADNFVTHSKNFGDETWLWSGGDLALNVRPGAGMMLQGSISTGRTTRDNCEIVAALPEMSFRSSGFGGGGANHDDLLGTEDALVAWVPDSFCRRVSNFLTSAKLVGSYTVPRVDVQLSATVLSLPGPRQDARYVATTADVQRSLGRGLAGGARNITLNILSPGTLYGERLNQLDLRVAKLLQIRQIRARLNVDLYNALNADTVIGVNQNFATWGRPTSVLAPRVGRISMQLDF
jgi:hypothetical protein